jgi:predicted amidohydrolase
MNRRSLLQIAGLSAVLAPETAARAGQGPEAPVRASTANRPPRKLLLGTVIYGPYGTYSGLDDHLKTLTGFVDAMAETAAKTYSGRGLDLAVLPETTVTDTNGPASQRAIPLKGPVLDSFAPLARRHKTYIVVPLDLAEESESGTVYSNAAVLLDRRGIVAGIYRKVHPVSVLPGDELEKGIAPGQAFPVFECDFGKLGIQICYDINFDDGWQALADKGAELVVWPSQCPATTLTAARAAKHRYFIVSSCWRNNSTFYEPTGFVAARIETPEKVLVHEIDLSYALLGWSSPLQNGKAFSDKYGARAGFHYETREDLGMFWSNDPQMTIGSMVQSLGLEEIDQQIARNRRLQNAARVGPVR